MSSWIRICAIAALAMFATAAVSAGAGTISPKPGRYDPDCPQGYQGICGEGVFIVIAGSKKLDKYAVVPWPNDPNNPSSGICGRHNPVVNSKIPIKNGKFDYSGTASGKSFTWTGKWVSKKKVTGKVEWAGCATTVKYTAKWVSAT